MERDRWSSKLIFIFAAVGSAVGLGNIWRFPYLAAKYGGGAFLIPYLVMLFLIGVPLLILEFAIGQRMQVGPVGSFSKIKQRLSSIGFGAVLSGFVVVSYYAVVMAWCLLYIFYSLSLSWGQDPKSFFFSDVLHLSNDISQMGGIVWPILLALAIVWALIYFSVWKGVKSVGQVVLVTMPLPVILLIVLLVRGITLPGAGDGILLYLKPDFKALLDIEVWQAAMSQIFFTLSLAFGVMIAYASYQHKRSDVAKSALTTSIINSTISIVAGFAVFSTLGYMAYTSGEPLKELAQSSGPSLAFVVFPKALSLMPMAPLFAVLFFVMLITLGIDSAFSLVEAVATVINDKYPHIKRERVSLWVVISGFIAGIIFTTNAGLYYLDIVDHFITSYGLVLVGILETLAVGWMYGAVKLRAYINGVSDIKIGKWWDVLVKFVIPLLLVALFISGIYSDFTDTYGGYPSKYVAVLGWGMLFVVLLMSVFLSLFSEE